MIYISCVNIYNQNLNNSKINDFNCDNFLITVFRLGIRHSLINDRLNTCGSIRGKRMIYYNFHYL